MPSKTRKATVWETALPSIPKELIDQFVTGPMGAEAVNATSLAFKKALIERALGPSPRNAGNHHNGATSKTILIDEGPLRIKVPRDRDGSFEPLLIPQQERRFTGFDDKIIAMYAHGRLSTSQKVSRNASATRRQRIADEYFRAKRCTTNVSKPRPHDFKSPSVFRPIQSNP
ncbi:transposase-like protein [Methylocaldum sp. RMAD-M]|jgi:transposase-like protein|nr:transposase-like protein [Methylocaldum sp. RMAD-M]